MNNLMKWSKMAQMLAPKLAEQYHNYYLIMGYKNSSAPEIRSNYKTIKKQLSDSIELQVNGSSYLLIPMDSKQVDTAESLVAKAKNEVYLDTQDYESELAMDNLHHNKPIVNCALCYKPLSSERSRYSNLGPICEHRLNQIVENEEVKLPDNWNSVYTEEIEQGELIWIKTKNDINFVEIMSVKGDEIVLLDRKNMEKELSKNNNYTEVLKRNMQVLNKSQVEGISRITPKKVESTNMFEDLMKDLFNE